MSSTDSTPTTNPFDVLGLTPDATWLEIKETYHKLAALHHPDRGGDEQEFKEINDAHHRLTKPSERAYWREQLRKRQSERKREVAVVKTSARRNAGSTSAAPPAPTARAYEWQNIAEVASGVAAALGRFIGYTVPRAPRIVVVGTLLVGFGFVGSWAIRACSSITSKIGTDNGLVKGMPKTEAESCRWAGVVSHLPAHATGAIACGWRGEMYESATFNSQVVQFGTRVDMERWFNAQIPQGVHRSGEGSCVAAGHVAPYRFAGERQPSNGLVACFIDREHGPTFVWTIADEARGVRAYATTNFRRTYRWWRHNAGPEGPYTGAVEKVR